MIKKISISLGLLTLLSSNVSAVDLEVGIDGQTEWTLMGITGAEANISNLSSLSNIEKIVGWDCSSGTCTTVSYVTADKAFWESIGSSYSPSLPTLKNGGGYWIKTNGKINLNLEDSTTYVPNIVADWNLIAGNDSNISTYVQELNNNGLSINKIVGWDCSSGTCTTVSYVTADKEFWESIGSAYSPSLQNISSNSGYWVKVDTIEQTKYQTWLDSLSSDTSSEGIETPPDIPDMGTSSSTTVETPPSVPPLQ